MAKAKHPVYDPAFLRAALEGLQLQHQRLQEQIDYVKAELGRRRAGGGVRVVAPAKSKPAGKRNLSAAARKRIAAAQKKRWAAYRKARASGA